MAFHEGRDVSSHFGFNLLAVFFFFFQAEDGIRDDLVTGVQTCALPISMGTSKTQTGKTRRVLFLSVYVIICFVFVAFAALSTPAQSTDTIPPSSPIGLTGTAATCGQGDLSWGASTDNVGGSELQAYTIYRTDGVNTSIGAVRTSFSDTKWLIAATTL